MELFRRWVYFFSKQNLLNKKYGNSSEVFNQFKKNLWTEQSWLFATACTRFNYTKLVSAFNTYFVSMVFQHSGFPMKANSSKKNSCQVCNTHSPSLHVRHEIISSCSPWKPFPQIHRYERTQTWLQLKLSCPECSLWENPQTCIDCKVETRLMHWYKS